ncbi:MAG: hypothetical protein ACI35K_03945 [Campylobacter sp.]
MLPQLQKHTTPLAKYSAASVAKLRKNERSRTWRASSEVFLKFRCDSGARRATRSKHENITNKSVYFKHA